MLKGTLVNVSDEICGRYVLISSRLNLYSVTLYGEYCVPSTIKENMTAYELKEKAKHWDLHLIEDEGDMTK